MISAWLPWSANLKERKEQWLSLQQSFRELLSEISEQLAIIEADKAIECERGAALVAVNE